MKKSFLQIIPLLILLFVITGCSGGNTGTVSVPVSDVTDQKVIFNDFENSCSVWAWNSKTTTMKLTDAMYYQADETDPRVIKTHSLMLIATGSGCGGGIQPGDETWDINLNPTGTNTKLTVWVYAIPDNSSADDVNIQFFDQEGQKVTDKSTTNKFMPNQWSQLTMDLPSGVDLHHINKLQVQVSSSGIYYFDDFIAEP